jgi:hypothetical protein
VGSPPTCEKPNFTPSSPNAQDCYARGLLPTTHGCRAGE